MADGTDRRPGTRPLLYECAACQRAGTLYHTCAFLTGVFNPANWGCASLAKLEPHALVVYGDELDLLVIERPNGSMVVLGRRVGEAHRVRVAQVITAKGQVIPLSVAEIEDILGQQGANGGRHV